MSDKYMDLLMAGEASIDEFPDYVVRWHEDQGFDGEVFEYLGMTWPEYRLVCVDEDRLRYVAAARRRGILIEAASPNQDDFALAARSGNSKELAALVSFLMEQGHLKI